MTDRYEAALRVIATWDEQAARRLLKAWGRADWERLPTRYVYAAVAKEAINMSNDTQKFLTQTTPSPRSQRLSPDLKKRE